MTGQKIVAGLEVAIAHAKSVTLGDKIRAMQLGLPIGGTAHTALDRAAALADQHAATTLQRRVEPWMQACFGAEISADKLERGDRFLEEVFELLQSGDYPRERVAALEEYVWSRDRGEPHQEVGGVMITLAAYCLAHGLNMHQAGEDELARIWTKVEKIRAKQAEKPKGSALPIAVTARPVDEHEATIAAAYEAAKAWLLDFEMLDDNDQPMPLDVGALVTLIAGMPERLTDADAAAALDRIKTEAVRGALSDFAKADWFWRDLDPDDSGDTPDEAINAGMVGRFTVCLIRSAFTGPDRFCFISPVLDPESDDEECLCFRTEDEAIAAAKERRTILAAVKEAGNG